MSPDYLPPGFSLLELRLKLASDEIPVGSLLFNTGKELVPYISGHTDPSRSSTADPKVLFTQKQGNVLPPTRKQNQALFTQCQLRLCLNSSAKLQEMSWKWGSQIYFGACARRC